MRQFAHVKTIIACTHKPVNIEECWICMLSCCLQNNSPAAVNDYLHDGSPGDQVGSGHRAAQLEPFIQEQCSGAVQSMVEQVHSQLQHLGQPAMDLQGAQLVEQALLLGRLPLCLIASLSLALSSE